MGERKVLNKYIPADFDPALVPRGTKLSKKDGTVPVRMMLPFSIQCNTCHTFMYRGRKFNSKKEAVTGEKAKYLGIQRWRFYIKCVQCARTVSFLTDPKNADYEMESGASRNYEVYKDKAATEESIELEQIQEEKLDPMKALENRVLQSQREMADLDNLEEIKAMNARHVKLLKAKNNNNNDNNGESGFDADTKAVLEARDRKILQQLQQEELNEHGLTEEDEQLVQSIQFGSKTATNNNNNDNKKKIHRLTEQDEQCLEQERKKRQLEMMKQAQEQKKVLEKKPSVIVPIIKKVKRKRNDNAQTDTNYNDDDDNSKNKNSKPKIAPAPAGLSGLLGNYGSESDSD